MGLLTQHLQRAFHADQKGISVRRVINRIAAANTRNNAIFIRFIATHFIFRPH